MSVCFTVPHHPTAFIALFPLHLSIEQLLFPMLVCTVKQVVPCWSQTWHGLSMCRWPYCRSWIVNWFEVTLSEVAVSHAEWLESSKVISFLLCSQTSWSDSWNKTEGTSAHGPDCDRPNPRIQALTRLAQAYCFMVCLIFTMAYCFHFPFKGTKR